MKQLLIGTLFLLSPFLIGAFCDSVVFTPNTVNVIETVEVIKEVEVVKEVVVTPEGQAELAQEFDPPPVQEEPKETITFHEGDWDSTVILNAIAMYITEHGYGYPVEWITASGDTVMVYFPLGDIDIILELWRANKQDWYDENVATGRIIDLGAVFESSTQGWYVPRYVIEGDSQRNIEASAPELKSVTDLPQYWEIFQDPDDPDKGLWINTPVDWRSTRILQLKAQTYGLDETFNGKIPKNEAELTGAIVDAYERGEPVLAYYWEPTWVMGKYDMVLLEEPDFTEKCWEDIVVAIDQEPLGTIDEACAFPDYDIHKAVYGGLLDESPELVSFIRKMFVGTKRVNELAAYMADNDANPEEVAIYYLKNFENDWTRWVPADVADKVKASLP